MGYFKFLPAALLLNFLFSTINLCSQYSGTLTVGGQSPRFNTLAIAFDSLETYGISGNTTLALRPGTYTGSTSSKFTLSSFSNTNSNHKLIIQPDASHSGQVYITGATSYSYPYVVLIENSHNIEFKNLNFKAISQTVGNNYLLTFLDSCTNMTIENCSFFSPIFSSSSAHYGIYKPIGNRKYLDDLTVRNCVFQGGGVGYYSELKSKNIRFEYNEFLDWSHAGMYCAGHENLDVNNNYLKSGSSVTSGFYGKPTTATALYFKGSQNARIDANKIEIVSTNKNATGIRADGVGSSNAANGFIVSNNSVSILKLGSAGQFQGIHANSSTNLTVAFNSLFTLPPYGNLLFSNNNSSSKFVNNVAHHNGSGYAYFQSGSSTPTESNNVLYSRLGDSANVAIHSTSVSVDPDFLANDDLRSYSKSLFNNGVPVSGVNQDAFGNSRSSTDPSRGILEFKLGSYDIGVTNMNVSVACGSNSPIYAVVKNYGFNDIDSFIVYSEITDDQGTSRIFDSIKISTSLQIDSSNTFLVRSHNFQEKRARIKLWTKVLGLNLDSNFTNDTLNIVPRKPMKGDFYIGSASTADFPNIQTAYDTLKARGICGHVIFNVQPESYLIMPQLTSVTGMNASNTLTIQSDTNYVLQAAFGQSSFKITNGNGYRFHNISIEQTGAGPVVELVGTNQNLTFENCLLKGKFSTSVLNNRSIIYCPSNSSNAVSKILIKNNTFKYGSTAIFLNGYNSSTRSIQIINNEIDSFSRAAMNILKADSVIITNNRIANKISDRALYGIYIQEVTKSRVESNEIRMLGSSAGDNCYNIYSSNCTNTAQHPNRIVNNYLDLKKGGVPVFIIGGTNTQLWYNTILSTDKGAQNTGWVVYTSGSGTVVRNNILFCNGPGTLYGFSNISNFSQCTNNLLYTENVKVGGTYDFQSWKSQGKDQNSAFGKPLFRSKNSFVPTSRFANDSAVFSSFVPRDFYGNLRNAVRPDIGCVEFTPFTNDLGIDSILLSETCGGLGYLKFKVRNTGSNGITGASFKAIIDTNGTPYQIGGNVTTSLPVYGTKSVGIGPIYLSKNTPSVIKLYVDSVNGTPSAGTDNDTVYTSHIFNQLSGTFSIGGSGADFTNVSQAYTQMRNKGICGPVVLNVNSGTTGGVLPAFLDDIPGSSSTNTITIQTNPSDTIQARLSKIDFRSSRYYVVRNVLVEDTNYNKNCVNFSGKCSDIVLSRNTFIGCTTGDSSVTGSVIRFEPQNTSEFINITIDSNQIINGRHGITTRHKIGFGYSSYISKIRITNNLIKDFYFQGIGLEYIQDSLVIKGNNIENEVTSNYWYGGLFQFGIKLWNSNNVLISANDIKMTHHTGAFIRGGANVRISNNFIVMYDSSSTVQTRGLSMYLGGDAVVSNNSVVVHQNSSNASCADLNQNARIAFINNCLVAKNGYCVIYKNKYPSQHNRNVYYANSASIIQELPNSWTLQQFQSFGYDTNSYFGKPTFESYLDLHSSSVVLNNRASVVPWINTDIDGEQRSSTSPDIGADEFKPLDYDIALLNQLNKDSICTNTPISILVKNNGGIGLDSVRLRIKIDTNGTAFQMYDTTVIQRLGSDSSTLFNVSNPSSFTNRVYNLEVIPLKLNDSLDQNRDNDTLRIQYFTLQNPIASIGTPPVSCTNTPPIALTHGSGTPLGGTGVFSGTLMLNNTFYPSFVQAGKHPYSFTYTLPNGCKDVVHDSILVNNKPTVSLTSKVNICEDTTHFTLAHGLPSGGVYRGNHILGSAFRVDSAKAGLHNISYVFTDMNGCMDSTTGTIEVLALPTMGYSGQTRFCESVQNYPITGFTPSGGSISGGNVTGGMFSAVIGSKTDTLNYAYTDTNGCSNDLMVPLIIDSLTPLVNSSSIDTVCSNTPKFRLNTAIPVGGLYKINGVIDSSFDAQSLGLGRQQVEYVFGNSLGCFSALTYYIQVNPFSSITAGASPLICDSDSNFVLNHLSPLGGFYHGQSFIDSNGTVRIWKTQHGNYPVNYVYKDSNHCFDSTQFIISINESPTVELGNDTIICDTTIEYDVTSQIAGITYLWENGDTNAIRTISSTGVKSISLTAPSGCMAFDTVEVLVDTFPKSTLIPQITLCPNNNSAILQAGNQHYSRKWSTGDTSKTISVSNAGMYTIELSSFDGCVIRDTTQVQFNAICVGLNEFMSSSNWQELKVYPNPVSDHLSFELNGNYFGKMRYTILSSEGKQARIGYLLKGEHLHKQTIDVSELASGNYMISVSGNGQNWISRFVIQNH